MNTFRTVVLVLSLGGAIGAVGCRQAPPATPTPGPTNLDETEGSSTAAASQPPAEAPSAPSEPTPLDVDAVRALLPEFCSIVRQELAAAGEATIAERTARVSARLRDQPWSTTLEQFYAEHVGIGPIETRYARMQHGLSTMGIVDWRCNELIGLLSRQARAQGLRPYGAAEMPPEALAAALCETAQLPWVINALPAERQTVWGFEAAFRISGRDNGAFFNGLRQVAAAERYPAIVAHLVGRGVSEFSCEPLRLILEGAATPPAAEEPAPSPVSP